jgi:hypothetical protein
MRQLTLGELIKLLNKCTLTKNIYFDFCGFAPEAVRSYRGFYDQLAIEYAQKRVTVSEFLIMLQDVLGKYLAGYKGGSYLMTENTPVWVDNYGEAHNTVVADVEEYDNEVIIKTGYREW